MSKGIKWIQNMQAQVKAGWLCVQVGLFDLIFTTDTFFISHTIILWPGQNINCLSSAFTAERTDAFIVQPQKCKIYRRGNYDNTNL